MKRNLNPTIAAIAFFAMMTLVGIESAHAQINLLERQAVFSIEPSDGRMRCSNCIRFVG